MRYICKACGRKREATYLKIAGKAANTQNVWLCKEIYNRKCNQERHAEVTAEFLDKLAPADREIEENYRADLDHLAKSGAGNADVKIEKPAPKPVEETYICFCGERIGGWMFCFTCTKTKCQNEQARNMNYPKLLWKD